MSLSEYVKKGTDRHSDLAEVMARRKSAKAEELENLEFDALIAEQKKKLKEASPPTVDSSQATNFMTFLSSLFVGKSPAEIDAILTSLTKEQIDKLRLLSESNPNSLANLRGMIQPQNSSLKETIEIIKLILSMQQPQQPANNGFDMKGIAEIFKAGVEASRVQQPANPQPDIQYKMLESTLAELRATREETARQDRLRTEREIADLKARPSGFDELVYNEEKAAKVRKIFGGADTGAVNEFTLRKAEMDQTERLETRRLDWEEKKWEKEKDKEGNTLETVKEILAGPAGDILKSFGNAGAERIRGGVKANSNGQIQSPQIAKVKCPNCAGDFSANTQLSQIQCPLCGVQLQSSSQPAPQQEQPPQVPIEQPAPNTMPIQEHPSQITETTQEKPVDQTVEAESPVEQITAKQ